MLHNTLRSPADAALYLKTLLRSSLQSVKRTWCVSACLSGLIELSIIALAYAEISDSALADGDD